MDTKNIPSIIECIGRQERTDKNGKNYVALFFRNWKFFPIFNPQTGEFTYVREHSVVGYINQYPESYTSSKRPDANYDTAIGDLITGSVVTRYVVPYLTEKGFRVNYYNAVVFGNSLEDDWEEKIQKAFDKAGVTMVSKEAVDPNFIIAEEKPEDDMLNKDNFDLSDKDQRNTFLGLLENKGVKFLKPSKGFDDDAINF